MMPLARAAVWAAFAVLLVCRAAAAHERTTSYSSWELHGRDARVTLRLAALDATRFPWAGLPVAERDAALGRYASGRLRLRADDAPCEVRDGPRRLPGPPDRVVLTWDLRCPPGGALAMESGFLLDVAPAHLHIARLRRDGGPVLERVLSRAEPVWELPAAAPAGGGVAAGTPLGDYLRLGIEHILEGYDHLAFVLALLLASAALRDVVTVVTGFTIAHSVTLGAAVLGYVRPAAAPVEALIGLSIALVAIETVWIEAGHDPVIPTLLVGILAALALAAAAGHGTVPALTLAGVGLFAASHFALLRRTCDPARLRWAVAFVFGLVHGFGFAAVLGEAGLPSDRLLRALVGFNAGVEIGQLAVVVAVWPLLRLATTAGGGRYRPLVVEGGSAGVLALGVFWFVTRAFG